MIQTYNFEMEMKCHKYTLRKHNPVALISKCMLLLMKSGIHTFYSFLRIVFLTLCAVYACMCTWLCLCVGVCECMHTHVCVGICVSMQVSAKDSSMES